MAFSEKSILSRCITSRESVEWHTSIFLFAFVEFKKNLGIFPSFPLPKWSVCTCTSPTDEVFALRWPKLAKSPWCFYAYQKWSAWRKLMFLQISFNPVRFLEKSPAFHSWKMPASQKTSFRSRCISKTLVASLGGTSLISNYHPYACLVSGRSSLNHPKWIHTNPLVSWNVTCFSVCHQVCYTYIVYNHYCHISHMIPYNSIIPIIIYMFPFVFQYEPPFPFWTTLDFLRIVF